jgi:hypothetical protein
VTLGGLGGGDGAQQLPQEPDVRVVQRVADSAIVQFAGGQVVEFFASGHGTNSTRGH